jgi:hypothetical protein
MKQQRIFTTEDEEMLQPVVAYAAIAIEQANHKWTAPGI